MLYTRLEDISPQIFDRIVSVVPSQTQLLHDLNLYNEVLGITKFCVHPIEWKENKTIVGGTKNLNINKILSLSPDLIIANKEENVQTQIEALAAETTVFLTDVDNYDDALDMIRQLGQLTGRKVESDTIVTRIQNGFEVMSRMVVHPSKVVYLIWNDPMMTVGGDTFINSMLQKSGFQNVFAHNCRYPTITREMIAASEAEYLFLSSEPYPFTKKHMADFQKVFTGLKIKMVDGEMFSWYGSNMMDAPAYFEKLRKDLWIC